jgi:hypothetical protein
MATFWNPTHVVGGHARQGRQDGEHAKQPSPDADHDGADRTHRRGRDGPEAPPGPDPVSGGEEPGHGEGGEPERETEDDLGQGREGRVRREVDAWGR